MNNAKEAKELTPNQDLKINAALMGMWKKAGLRVKSFKATKKGHNEIWSGEFKTKNAILSMSVNKYGNVFYHAGNKSVNIGRLDKQSKIIEWMKAIIKNSPWSESVSESLLDDEKTGYLHMMKMRKSNKTMFWQMTKAMGSDWGKLVKKAEKYGWTKLKESAEPPTLSRNEAFGDINDAGFKKIKDGFKYLDKVTKKLQVAVKKEDAKETIKSIKGLYDIAGIMYDMIGVPRFYESVNEASLPSNIQKWVMDRGSKPSKDVKMIGKWVKKLTGHEISGGVAIGKNYNTLVLDIEHQDAAIHYDTTSGEIKLYKKKIRSFNDFEKVFQANESVFVNEKIERGNEVHAETKKELKDAIAKSMKEILAGKTPKYDIINGMSGEMIGWKDGKDYVWQPNAIPYAERELK